MRFGFGHRKDPPDPESPRTKELLEIIKALKPGELVEVIWIDACISRDRKLSVLDNHDFATYKRTPGYYCALVADHRYNQYHLIVAIEETDGFDRSARSDITSIPLAIVMSIRRSGVKQAQVAVKGPGRRLALVPVRPMGFSEVRVLDGRGYKFTGPEEKRG